MNDTSLSAAEWQRQARQHLESLRVAGVEWLPKAPPPAVPLTPQPVAPAELFVEIPPPPVAAGIPQLTLQQRRLQLATLAESIRACTRCAELCSTRTQTVFADGQAGAELCFIGEAPGADEDAQGKPFVGAAGQLLDRIIAACGLKREDVYICNILKCRPPNNRTPKPEEANNCRDYLARQIDLVQPKFICTLGGCAAQNLLNTTMSLGKLRGRFHDYRGIAVLCTYHPAYLLPHRSPEKKREVWEDMQLLIARMGRILPGR
jgi:uracil-DNA glycosylase family 4